MIDKLVKKKRLQCNGPLKNRFHMLLPKMWVDEMEWHQLTPLVMEWLPHRQQIVISVDNEKISKSKPSEYRDSQTAGQVDE